MVTRPITIRRAAHALGIALVGVLLAVPGRGADGGHEPASPAGGTGDAPVATAPAPAATTPADVERLLQQLGQRGAALDRREQEVAARERSIAELEAEVSRRLGELETLRGQIEARLAGFKKENGDSVQRLVKVYAEMPPAQAAHLLESLDPVLATDVVRRMKHKQAAAILALMTPATALRISELVARPLANVTAVGGPTAPRPGATP